MFIDGFVISMYRSFGPDYQKIGPLGKVNLFIGQNNSGKSNILLFVKNHLRGALADIINLSRAGTSTLNIQGLDSHRGASGLPIYGFALSHAGDQYAAALEDYRGKLPKNDYSTPNQEYQIRQRLEAIDALLKSSALTQGGDASWFLFQSGGQIFQEQLEALAKEEAFDRNWWHHAYISVSASERVAAQSDLKLNDKILTVMSYVGKHIPDLPEIELIPAIRSIGSSATTPDDYSGLGIIRRLAELQNPELDNLHHKQQFQTINDFVKTILGNSTAKLEIPVSQSAIHVDVDGRTLPLSSLGTGVHQVVIMAAMATLLENQVVCVEEPELHLHPVLQRKLIRYLKNKTSNQYFITTHSAHFLDTPDAHIFHVRHHEGQTRVDPVYTAKHKSEICADLGYRASDLLQANCVIWVEGPTDRIYLKHWIKSVAEDLVEGLHYSIMFYGGRLLSHLSANDPEVEQFISLRRLNRYIAILIDSDRESSDDTINATKIRIQDEFGKGPGFAWITEGREVENYIPAAILETSVKSVYPVASRLAHNGQYDHAYAFVRNDGATNDEPDKVKIAHQVIEHPADLGVLDLQVRIGELVAFIRSANDDEVLILT